MITDGFYTGPRNVTDIPDNLNRLAWIAGRLAGLAGTVRHIDFDRSTGAHAAHDA